MKKILFSAIGTSDPVRNFYDGPWLHCLRNELPDLTVLYLSAEMTGYEERHHFYSRTVELFNKDLEAKGKPPVAYELIPNPELTDPNRYGNLYYDLQRILVEIHTRFPDAELIINCSSGTPAIKNCLADMRILLPFGEGLRLLQVDDPHKGEGANSGRITDSYDLDSEWASDEDRNENFCPRVHLLAPDQHDMMIRAEYAKVLIRRHDYSAAMLLIGKDLANYEEGEKIRKALEGADRRKMLQLQIAGVLLDEAGIPNRKLQMESKTSRIRHCAELLLNMQNNAEDHDYAGMLRQITPFIFTLGVEVIKKELKCDLDSYKKTEKDTKSGKERTSFDWYGLQKDYPKYFQDIRTKFPDDIKEFLGLKHMIPIMEQELMDKEIASLFTRLRAIEATARNEAAHEICGIGDEWIGRRTGMSAEAILDACGKLLAKIEPRYGGSFRKCYREMDEAICDLLKIREKKD